MSARSLTTRATTSPFRIAATQSKFTSITFRRFASDDVRAAEEALDEQVPAESSEAPDTSTRAAYPYDQPPPIRGVRPELPPNNSIYVGNLQFDVTEEDLKREFAEFGNVKSALIATEPRGLSKGYVLLSVSRERLCKSQVVLTYAN